MNKRLIFIGSITKTIRARDILNRNGIKSKIERVTGDVQNGGCGYGIIVINGDRNEAVEILNNNGYSIDSREW